MPAHALSRTAYATTVHGPTPPVSSAESRDWPTLLFVLISLTVAMSVEQQSYEAPPRLQYLLFLWTAVLVPFLRPVALLQAVGTKAVWLLFFLLIAGSWHALRGDYAAVFQIGLMAVVFTWHNAPGVRINPSDIRKIYLALIGVGFVIWNVTDLNLWGLIPGTTASEYGIWRISFYPNIAFTAFLSLLVVMLETRDGWRRALRSPVFWIAMYFVLFSFVRTAIIALAIYAALSILFSLRPRSGPYLFTTALVLSLLTNLMIAYSAVIFSGLQDIPIVSRLFLRGEVGLTTYEIYQQLYRPWLWSQHFEQFWNSDYMMGWGSRDFESLVTTELFEGREQQSDSVSLLTRILAQLGLPALLFWVYMLHCLVERARARDGWACAAYPVVILGMLQWGGLFHASDAVGLMLMLIIVKGRAAFTSDEQRSAQPAGSPRGAAR